MPTIMEPSKVKYAYVEEGVERLDYYVRGGYHPVKIGDEFQEGRYVIAHKLGFGGSATTWLAEDKVMKKLVALKISTDSFTTGQVSISVARKSHSPDIARFFHPLWAEWDASVLGYGCCEGQHSCCKGHGLSPPSPA
ncbi:hypothetical protein D8B26_001089 [Coccidioides posadasii str. Silveira]|uniref:uncharacterized protein n=1 Tax=Coccidioides posadasii (strain RMSCC 757 / Silveira) TaxID=443226 RepID=UPI001BF149DE|nr:hypothetical protein D8B26_001089 [Coccidioides posadasii str. Silveira]